MTPGEQSIERVVPAESARKLVDAEHRGRYAWAARLAAGRDVLDAGCGTGYGSGILLAAGARSVEGVDIAPEAVERASAAVPNVDFRVADLLALPHADASFDLVVCFEVIEHVERHDDVLAELARVLRPGGILAISSPNRDVYPPGNEFHVHEFTPSELEEAARGHFAHVVLYRQYPWLASTIVADDLLAALSDGQRQTIESQAFAPLDGGEMFTVALASEQPLPTVAALTSLCSGFELRWWQEQLAAATERADRVERDARDVWRTKEQVDRLLHAANLEAEAARRQARETAERLVALERQLADQIAQSAGARSHLAKREAEIRERELEFEEARALAARGYRIIEDMKRSPSWRLTAPLRAAKRFVKR